MRTTLRVAVIAIAMTSLQGSAAGQAGGSVTYRAPSGITLTILLDDRNVGSEVSMAEMTFPPNLDSGEHQHGAIEMFYVLSGELEHVVNGRSYVLKPGMTGYVKIGDKVRHKTGPGGPVKTLVVWVPGAEAGKIAARWKREEGF